MQNIYIILLSFFCFLTISAIFYIVGSFLACKYYRIEIEKVQLFYGKPIFEFKIKQQTLAIGWIPTGGSVHFDFENVVLKRSRFTRIILNLSGPVFVIFSAIICLGPLETISQVLSGFPQIIDGVIHPFALGKKYVTTFFSNVVPQSIINAYGILASKVAATNLLPIPSSNGGNVMLEFFISPKNLKTRIAINNIGFIIYFAFFVCWLLAFASFLIEQL